MCAQLYADDVQACLTADAYPIEALHADPSPVLWAFAPSARLSKVSFNFPLPAPLPVKIVASPRLYPQSGIASHWLSNHFPESILKHFLYNLNLCYLTALGFGALLSSLHSSGAIKIIFNE